MRRFVVFISLLVVLASGYGTSSAITGIPVMYHYDAMTGTLIKNYRMADEESVSLGLPPFTYVSGFAFSTEGLETIYCYGNGDDPATITVVRRDLVTNAILWSRVYDGIECGLGQGSYSSDNTSFMMGVIIYFPWDSPPLALGPFGYRYANLSVATGDINFQLDMYDMPALEAGVGWRAETFQNASGSYVFKMEPRAIEGGDFDGRAFSWDGTTTVFDVDPNIARSGALVTYWNEIFWAEEDLSLPAVASELPYLRVKNTVKVSAPGGTPRTIFHTATGLITAIDPIRRDGLSITYITNADDFTASTLQYETIDLYRDGAIALRYSGDQAPPTRVWIMPEFPGTVTPFETWGGPMLGEPPVMPSETPVALGAPPIDTSGIFTYHYEFDTQSLVRNYLIDEARFPLGVPIDRYVQSFAIDRDGINAIFCYGNYDTTPETVTIVRKEIATGIPLWTRTVEGKMCSLGLGSWADDGSTFAMGLALGYQWDPAPVVGPYQFTYGLYSTVTGALVNQLDLNYVPFGDLTQTYAMETLSNTGTQTVFTASPIYIEGPGGPGDVYAWDGVFGITPRSNEAGLLYALPWSTGEVFWPEYDPARPTTEIYMPYIEPYNVLRYHRDGVNRTIYANGTQPIMSVDPWPGYGVRLTLLTNPMAVDGMYNYTFLILGRDGVGIGPFGSVNRYPSLAWVRRDGAIPTVMPDFVVSAATAPTPGAPSSAFTCPGFMPSRLVVGARGQVTPGTPNNLRAEPSATSARVGQIPGNGVFDIVAGPVCDPAGRAWWQVVYAGVTGWTVEGQGTDYYTLPLP